MTNIVFRYLVSKLFQPLFGCGISALRILNAQALCAIFISSYGVLRTLRLRHNPAKRLHEGEDIAGRHLSTPDPMVMIDVHSAFNIALFPPLFFFSALYYTDVMSTLAVLLAYIAYLQKPKTGGGVVPNASAVVLGVVALLFRQTNIFWVAVFPAGLAAVDALKVDTLFATSKSRNITAVVQSSWNEGTIYDCSVQDAGSQGT
jgi:alpha-1,2-glucosyltransferase